MTPLPEKRVHTLILDSGCIIKNQPPVSALLNQAEELITVPSIISEIRDAATRSRMETTLKPFLTLRSPSAGSLKFVTDFARRTGDLAVLSKPDIQIIALAYEIECERNHGDWRLRRSPGQKQVNGPPPIGLNPGLGTGFDSEQNGKGEDDGDREKDSTEIDSETSLRHTQSLDSQNNTLEPTSHVHSPASNAPHCVTEDTLSPTVPPVEPVDIALGVDANAVQEVESTKPDLDDLEAPGSDSDGWITPSNLKRTQARDANSSIAQSAEPKLMQVAVITTDFAMQNVLLQINLNLLSPSLSRVKHIKTHVLRCHACFQVTKDLAKQFCPRCGQATLTRVSCSTNANGEFQLHLKKNMQWNHRGDRYSVPKPVHGSANGRVKGGGKGGWGNDLILSEDQSKYQVAVREEKKSKERSLMDEDYLPGILTGERGKPAASVRVGAGRNVNSRKR